MTLTDAGALRHVCPAALGPRLAWPTAHGCYSRKRSRLASDLEIILANRAAVVEAFGSGPARRRILAAAPHGLGD